MINKGTNSDKKKKKFSIYFCIKVSLFPNFSNMGVFYHDEPPKISRKCKFLTATLKDAFSNCRARRRLPTSRPEVEHPSSDGDDEQEVLYV